MAIAVAPLGFSRHAVRPAHQHCASWHWRRAMASDLYDEEAERPPWCDYCSSYHFGAAGVGLPCDNDDYNSPRYHD